MGFVKYHDRIKDYNFSPDCTIFNYDTTYFLCKDGPLVYDHGIGGYIEPRLGGNLNQPDWFYFKKTIEEQKPYKIIIPEAFVNGYYPDIKNFFETEIFQMGYGGKGNEDKLMVYIQKEQNFFHEEIVAAADWFYQEENIEKYPNMVYHSLGHNVPSENPYFDVFKKYTFCKQGFANESFGKLYALRNSTPLNEIEKRKTANFEPGKIVFYGNLATANRPTLQRAANLTKKINLEIITYGEENLNDAILGNRGVGASFDGLVFATIRDNEFGINCTPSIKYTRASNFIKINNNIDMFGTRFLKTLPGKLSAADDELEPYVKALEEGYEEYMDIGIHNYEKDLKLNRFSFFITLLQKFYNIELFVYDILFGCDLEEFIEHRLPLKVDFSVFNEAAKPEFIIRNDKKSMTTEYIKELGHHFDERFKAQYNKKFNK